MAAAVGVAKTIVGKFWWHGDSKNGNSDCSNEDNNDNNISGGSGSSRGDKDNGAYSSGRGHRQQPFKRGSIPILNNTLLLKSAKIC